MKYAINIADLHARKDELPLMLLVQPVMSRNIVKCEGLNMDGVAVVLACDEERAVAILSIIRGKYLRHELRCYQSITGKGGWTRCAESKGKPNA